MSIGRIGNYEVLERIGEGGMGVVFKARDARLFRTVALKILPERFQQDREHADRLLREARTLAALNHPHIATCYDCGEGRPDPADLQAPGSPGPHPALVLYIAMEYVPGRDLRSVIAGGAVPLREVARLAVQIASGLDAAHRAGVTHRDLTPSNIRVTPEGEVKLLDFGLARTAERPEALSTDSGTGRRAIVGTLGYMSPEQASGRHLDARTDLFSFGVILYELITSHEPFEGETSLEVLNAIANTDPHPLSRYAANVPPELERIVAKLLEKAPGDRYQSAHEVLTDLKRLDEALPRSSRRSGATGPRPLTVPMPRVAIVVLLMLAVAIVTGLWPLLVPTRTEAQRVAFVDFRNRTGNQDFDYVCAGLVTDLLDALVQGTDLTVTRSEMRTTSGEPQSDPRVIARELGVGRVITGDLEPTLAGPLLHVRILDGRRGFERERRDFPISFPLTYPLRQAIVAEIAKALGTRLSTPTHDSGRHAPSSNATYEAYLRGLNELGDPDTPLARDRALAAFDRAIAADSGFALAWAGRARALWWLYDRDHDVELLQRAAEAAAAGVRLGPDLVPTRLAKARIDRETGHLQDAIAELRGVLLASPSHDEAYLQLGAALRRAGELGQAESSYQRAVELRPAAWRSWNTLGGFLLGARGDYARARLAYEKVIALAPESNRGYEGLGNVFVAEGRYADAIAAFHRLPRPVTSSALASNIANAHFFSRQLDAALQYYLLAVSLEPGDAVMRQNLGDCYQRMRRGAEARAQYLEAVKLHRPALQVDPGSPRLSVAMAVYFAKAGECDSSRTWLATGESRRLEGDAEILHALAKAHALCGRPEAALDALRKMVRLGSPAGMLRDEDEFRDLRSNPEFRRIADGS